MKSVSIYLFAGDFVDVLKRYDEGREQTYQTHNEVARLIHGLVDADVRVKLYSFLSPARTEARPLPNVTIITLGASSYNTPSLLREAVGRDDSDAIVAQFPNPELLKAVIKSQKRAMAVLATSYNRTGLRAALGRRRIVSLLNNPRFELVSNHGLPATEHLSAIGVRRDKLIAWDIPHPFDPENKAPKHLPVKPRYELAYAGSIVADKGIGDLILAVAILRQKGLEVHCSLAGLGDILGMQALANKHEVGDLISFVGLIGNTNVYDMMVAADLVVVPSRTEYPEGFPLTMFEAIASRTPIVCSDHPMFRNILHDGRHVSVFPAGDPQLLADAIQRTLSDSALYAVLSRNASESWATLKGPADWRTMIVSWVVSGRSAPEITAHLLGSERKLARSGAPL